MYRIQLIVHENDNGVVSNNRLAPGGLRNKALKIILNLVFYNLISTKYMKLQCRREILTMHSPDTFCNRMIAQYIIFSCFICYVWIIIYKTVHNYD